MRTGINGEEKVAAASKKAGGRSPPGRLGDRPYAGCYILVEFKGFE